MLSLFSKPKYDWISVKEYDDMSIKEKLKYHKSQGEYAEELPTSYSPHSEVIVINMNLCRKYEFEKHKIEIGYESEFDIEERKKEWLNVGNLNFDIARITPSLIYKLNNGNDLVITTFEGRIPCTIFEINGEKIASVTGFLSVISYKDESYKEEIREVLRKLKQEEDNMFKHKEE